MRPSTYVAGFVALWALALPLESSADELPPAQRWIPDNAILVVEVSRPEQLLEPLLSAETAEAVTSMPAYKERASQPDFRQFYGAVAYVENQLGTDWRTGLRTLLDGGVTLAVLPDQSTLLFVDGKDAKMLQKLHETLLGFARMSATTEGQQDRVSSQEYRGVKSWSLGPEENHILLGKRLVISNRPETLKGLLDRRAEGQGKSLADLPAYRQATKAAGPKAAVRLFINMGILKQHPPFMQSLTQDQNPLGALLLAGITDALQKSNWASVALKVGKGGVELKAAVDGEAATDKGPASFASPSDPSKGAAPNLQVPRRLAAATLYRDLHGFYAAKDELFPERTSGLIFFENMMGIFFSGLDLTEEVLAETEPEVRIVLARQEYDPSVGTPLVQWPAFAAVFHLKHPEKFGQVVEEAWQKAIGLVNFTRGQQALPGLIIDRFTHRETKYTVASYRPPKAEDRKNIDSRYNLSPAIALVGDSMVLSSTRGLAKNLIDTLRKEAAKPPKPLKEVHSLLEVNGPQVLSILEANREPMVRNNMLEKGHSEEQAESEISLLLTALTYLREAKLSLGSQDGHPTATLKLGIHKGKSKTAVVKNAGPVAEESVHGH